jgi:hypothetical protein
MRFLSRRALLIVPVFLLAFVVAGLPTVVFGDQDKNEFRARLLGVNEVPSINTVATGDVRLTLTASSIQFEVSWANLSSNPGAAHIHIGQRHTNGNVSAFFCGGGGKPACPAATSATITGTIVAADVIGPASQGIAAGDLAGLQRMIRLGATYSNVHTANFGGGEIRGQNVTKDKDQDKDD